MKDILILYGTKDWMDTEDTLSAIKENKLT